MRKLKLTPVRATAMLPMLNMRSGPVRPYVGQRRTDAAQRQNKPSAILGGDMLGGQWFRKQFWFIVTLTAMLIVYISNRYYCQQEMLETKALSDTLLDRRYSPRAQAS